jgi:hypothetical protein
MTPLQEGTHLRVLRTLQHNPHDTQRQLAVRLGVSLGANNFVLRALLETWPSKFAIFVETPRMQAMPIFLRLMGLRKKRSLILRFLRRKQKEYEALKTEIEVGSL